MPLLRNGKRVPRPYLSLYEYPRKYWTRWAGAPNDSASLLADFYTRWTGEANNSPSILQPLRLIPVHRINALVGGRPVWPASTTITTKERTS